MKRIPLFLFLFLFSSFYSCVKKTKKGTIDPIDGNLIIVNIDECKKEEEINASYFFNEVKTIILETTENVLIGNLRNFMVHDNYIIAFDDSPKGGLYIFHTDGHFSHKIGKEGGGPEEYRRITDFSLDKGKNEIYLLDHSNKRIMKYKLATGDFISSIKYAINRFPGSIQYYNNHLYLDACDAIDNNKELLHKIDIDNGSEICSWLNADVYNCGWLDANSLVDGFFLSRYAKTPKYANLLMDTVMSLTPTGIKPYLVVNSKNWVQKNDFKEVNIENRIDIFSYMNEKKKLFGICKLIEIQDAVFFNLLHTNNFYTVFTSPKETRFFKWMADDIVYKEGQFTINSMVCSDEQGVYAISHPQLFAGQTGQNIEDILKEDLDKRDLLIQLPEDSNPVIFYYKYKK